MSYIFLYGVLYKRGVQELKNHYQASTCQSALDIRFAILSVYCQVHIIPMPPPWHM